MSEDQFERRGNALEDMFFYRSDQELLEQIKQDLADKEAREQLASFSGITNEHLLDELVSQNVRAETLACVTLIPLVVVAWADGKLDEEEKLAVLRAFKEKGLATNPAAVSLVEGWLSEPPGEELFATWKDYIASLSAAMSGSTFEHLKASVLDQAKEVARAAGGFLGVINSESRSEKQAIEAVTAAFQAG